MLYSIHRTFSLNLGLFSFVGEPCLGIAKLHSKFMTVKNTGIMLAAGQTHRSNLGHTLRKSL